MLNYFKNLILSLFGKKPKSPMRTIYEDIHLSEEEADSLDDILRNGTARPTVTIPKRDQL